MKKKNTTGRGQKRVVLGIDFGASYLKALLLDEEGHEHGRFLEPSESSRGPEATLQQIANLAEHAKDRATACGLKLTDVGIGVCGPVDHANGEIIESPVLPGWKHVPVKEFVKRKVGLPVHLDNDANLAVLGEWWKGVGKGCSVVAGVTIGTGMGGGLVINGRIYRGGWGFGAEFGHISVAQDPPCLCGGRGCVGKVASAPQTVLRYLELAGAKAAPVEGVKKLAQLAKQGDPAAKEAIRISANYMAKATLILINCLDPEVFVIAGGMSLLGEQFLKPVREFVRSSTFRDVAMHTRIRKARFGLYSGCYGSAWLALSGTKALPE